MGDKSQWKENIVITYNTDLRELRLTTDIRGQTWPDVLQELVDFLRGVGYSIPDGEWRVDEEE